MNIIRETQSLLQQQQKDPVQIHTTAHAHMLTNSSSIT